MVHLEIYQSVEGHCPFEVWLNDLRDLRAWAKIRSRLNRLRLGNFGDTKAVGGGVHELRVDFGPGYRIYFGRHGASCVIIDCGGAKKSQDRDILRAQILWKEYKERMSENQK